MTPDTAGLSDAGTPRQTPPAGRDDVEAVQYVVGFVLDNHGRVALIRKNRPEWQAGRYNGIGGHVEPGETDTQAMRREFREETGADLSGWEPFVVMEFPGAVITFYRLRVGDAILDGLRSATDEPVSLHPVTDAAIFGFVGLAIPNLSWLVPLAAYTADRYEPIHVATESAEVLAARTAPSPDPAPDLAAAVAALAEEWETAHGDPPVDPSHISVRHARTLRAVLGDPTAALAAHDEQVRAEALREAADAIREWRHGHDGQGLSDQEWRRLMDAEDAVRALCRAEGSDDR